MNDAKYIGLDVHQATISATVLDSTGKLVMESILETKTGTLLQFIHGRRDTLHVTFEEGTCAAWLHDLLKPHVTQVLVRSAEECAAESRQQKRPHRFAETCRAAALQSSPVRLSRRHRHTNGEGNSAQLYDHHQRSHARDGSSESSLPKLGHPLCRSASLRTTSSRRLAGENRRGRRAPPGGALLPTVRCPAALAPASAARVFGREQEAQRNAVVVTSHRSGRFVQLCCSRSSRRHGSAPSDNCGATAAWPWRPATVEVILDNRRAPVLNAVALAAFAARAVPLA